jgi:hypothetical protein
VQRTAIEDISLCILTLPRKLAALMPSHYVAFRLWAALKERYRIVSVPNDP